MMVVNFPSRRIKVSVDSLLWWSWSLRCVQFFTTLNFTTLYMFEFETQWTFIGLWAPWVKMFEKSEKKICLRNMERLSTPVKVGFFPKTIQHRASLRLPICLHGDLDILNVLIPTYTAKHCCMLSRGLHTMYISNLAWKKADVWSMFFLTLLWQKQV